MSGSCVCVCVWLFYFTCCRPSDSTCQDTRFTLPLRSCMQMPDTDHEGLVVPACADHNNNNSSSSSNEGGTPLQDLSHRSESEELDPQQMTMRRLPSHQGTKPTFSLLAAVKTGDARRRERGRRELMSAADQKRHCCVCVSDEQTARNCFPSLVLFFYLSDLCLKGFNVFVFLNIYIYIYI